MQLVRGPSWVPVKLSIWVQVACIIAAMLAMSFWCIVIGAAYLVDPEVGATKLVAMSLFGLVIPFGTIAHFLAMPAVLWCRRVPPGPRWLLAVAPWLLISHPLMIRLPMVFHRSSSDILPGRFTWLWLSVTVLAAVIGPITAEQSYFARKGLKRRIAESQAKIAEIHAEAAARTAKLQEQLERDAEKRRQFAENQEAWKSANEAFADARAMFDDLRVSATGTPDWPRFLKIQEAYLSVLKANPASSTDGYRNRAKAIREFIRDTDWQRPDDLSSDSADSVSGDVPRATRH